MLPITASARAPFQRESTLYRWSSRLSKRGPNLRRYPLTDSGHELPQDRSHPTSSHLRHQSIPWIRNIRVQTIHPWFLWFMILWFTASWQKARLGDTTLLNYLQFVHEVGMTIVESGVQWPVQRPAANQILQSLKEMSPLDWWWYIWNILTYIWDCMGLYILYMGHKPLTKKGRHIQVPTVSTSTTRHIHRSLNFHPSVGSWCRR